MILFSLVFKKFKIFHNETKIRQVIEQEIKFFLCVAAGMCLSWACSLGQLGHGIGRPLRYISELAFCFPFQEAHSTGLGFYQLLATVGQSLK